MQRQSLIKQADMNFWGSIVIALFLQVSISGQVMAADSAEGEAFNMELVGLHDLQGRSAYQPFIHNYGGRRILFVGHHAGEALNPATGFVEQNGMSILDVSDPGNPIYLRHIPANGDNVSGTQHLQVCAGALLPEGDPDKVYLVRTNGLVSYEMFDVSDPAEPRLLNTIAETGYSSREESSRGDRETHKIQWECESGIGYLNGTPDGWRVTRVLQAFDLANPERPRHIRDFGLSGWEPGAEGPMPEFSISGLHQTFVVGNRMYLSYGSGNNGTLQILDLDKFLDGNPEADDPMAPTQENLLYPQISRLDFPSYWGAHTAKPIFDIPIPDYADNRELSYRDILIIPSEAGRRALHCQDSRDVVFFLDITQEDKPFPISTFQVEEASGGFCERGGRFGPHSVNDSYHSAFDRKLVLLSYFNAGIRAVDIRDPFRPVEVGYFIPATTENTAELCIDIDGESVCDSQIQTNNIDLDDRGYIYAVDRSSTGLHIVKLTGEAKDIVGIDYDF